MKCEREALVQIKSEDLVLIYCNLQGLVRCVQIIPGAWFFSAMMPLMSNFDDNMRGKMMENVLLKYTKINCQYLIDKTMVYIATYTD